MRDLPPMAAVRAFEAAARHKSFTKAAAELGMTQAAVSYQIRLLEEELGGALFLRQPRALELSELGRQLATPVSEAFASLKAAFAAVRSTTAGVLSITAAHTLATNWLLPRLGAFREAHPEVDVRLDTSHRTVDLFHEPFDLALRIGAGPWPGLEAHHLFPVVFTPMCSPALIERLGRPEMPADLLRLPLISPDDAWWPIWLEAAGVEGKLVLEAPALRLGVQQMEGRAALAGHGVALLTPAFHREELQAGRLVQLFPIMGSVERSYWLVYPKARRLLPKIRAFRQWLLAEVADDAPAQGVSSL
jgi:LysR family glycine cleavage system transcriptional activator